MIKVEILNKCTLLQACEWIADFKWEPMDKICEQYKGRKRPEDPMFSIKLDTEPEPTIPWKKYRDELSKASAALHLALAQKHVNATGILIAQEKLPLGATPLHKKRTALDYESFFSLDVENNRICIDNNPLFCDILIDFSELVSVFPGNIKNQPDGYKSKYMLLMEDVINQEGITDKNQSKQEYLRDIIANKMKEKGLPESNKLADAMATLIRQPWSQKGRNKKG